MRIYVAYEKDKSRSAHCACVCLCQVATDALRDLAKINKKQHDYGEQQLTAWLLQGSGKSLSEQAWDGGDFLENGNFSEKENGNFLIISVMQCGDNVDKRGKCQF